MECAYVHWQVCATFIDNPVGVEHRHQVGIDNGMWSSDSPHTAATWPQSQAVIARDVKDVPAAETWQMVRENVTPLSALDLVEGAPQREDRVMRTERAGMSHLAQRRERPCAPPPRTGRGLLTRR